jgi:hypothetical protein
MREFTKEDFTEEELMLLRLAFELLDTSVYTMDKLNYDNNSNIVYDLKEKLGIYDLLD